jgi:hypothetical protein
MARKANPNAHRDHGGMRNEEDPGLFALGLRRGDAVRFRHGSGNWHQGVVTGRERDGSVALQDSRGRSRAIAVERLEVRCRGPRGASTWEPLAERAARPEQLEIFG